MNILENIYNTLQTLLNGILSGDEHPMVFTEITFWIFFAFVLMGMAFIQKKNKLRNGFLFLVSLFFYYKTSGFFFTILLFSTVTDFYIGKAIFYSKEPKQKKSG